MSFEKIWEYRNITTVCYKLGKPEIGRHLCEIGSWGVLTVNWTGIIPLGELYCIVRSNSLQCTHTAYHRNSVHWMLRCVNSSAGRLDWTSQLAVLDWISRFVPVCSGLWMISVLNGSLQWISRCPAVLDRTIMQIIALHWIQEVC